VRIYFCSDIHASRKCWKKFLNSWKFYDADHIIVGGDITGKFVVPVIEQAGGVYKATFLGIDRTVEPGEELDTLLTRIADAGQYPWVTTPDEHATYEGRQDRIDDLFKKLLMDRAEEWMQEADEKLRGTGVRCFVSGANDDFFEIDDVIARSEVVEDPNGTVIELEGGFELMGMGYGNPTPWACPRDIPEDELAERIDKAAAGVKNMDRAIFSLHVPPLGSGLDIALRYILRKHNLEEKRDYTDVEINFPNMKAALGEHKVDLVSAVLPFMYDPELVKIGRTLFEQGAEIGPSELLMWASRTGYIQKNRAALVDLMEDVLRMQRWYFDPVNHQQAIAIVAKITKQPPEALDWVFSKRDFYRNPNGRPDLQAVAANLKMEKELGYLKTDIDVPKYADLSIVDDASKRLGK